MTLYELLVCFKGILPIRKNSKSGGTLRYMMSFYAIQLSQIHTLSIYLCLDRERESNFVSDSLKTFQLKLIYVKT